jgi:exosome complex component RRP41
MAYKKRFDGRSFDETREMNSAANTLKRAEGSGEFSFGKSKSLAAIYGPRRVYPDFLRQHDKAILRCTYDMISFSVKERKRPGPSRRSSEISLVSEGALKPAIKLEEFPHTTIDCFIMITQADASTRVAGINAAAIALANAGMPMTELPAAVSIGKMGDTLVVDVDKEEEDYEEDGKCAATDVAVCVLPRSKKVSLLQLDGSIKPSELKKAIEMAFKVAPKINKKQIEALKKVKEL